MSRCLVLGGNGFLGSHLVDSLVKQGHKVRVFDRFGDKRPKFIESDTIEVFSGNFMNTDDVDKALENIEYVFHFISTTTPASAENDPLIDVETNIKASIELFQACVKHNIKRVIFASTGGAVYGAGKSPYKETDTALPVSPYAIGKLTIEHYLRYFRKKHNLDSVVLRISNPYGERQPFGRRQGVIPIFLENLHAQKPLQVMGDGTMVRDYIYVKDVAAMATTLFDKHTKYSTYNIGSGEGTSINQLVDTITAATGVDPVVDTVPTPSTFVSDVTLDTARYESEFGPTERTALNDGVKLTYKYIKTGLGG